MEPIINPWIFYVINVICNLHFITGLLGTLSFGAIIVLVIYWVFTSDDKWNESAKENKRLAAKWAKRLGVFFIVDTAIGIFIPSKETMITMLVSNYVTPDNIQIVQGNIVDFTKQLVSAVAEGINQTGGK
ncbi:hypothetical protein CJ260_00555 [Megasphaera sp. ASD88]|uniref:hypothetical protein n=1 Tax=Megasphaera sp. ASD88 TaxID=2027407 RepID=UPI000BAB7951|nr:hypothetical protein [Megasphaera sp. ASD88]PAV39962.1 hypothetical protein CJ260_00555 [Megasphaera sp. ASD88]